MSFIAVLAQTFQITQFDVVLFGIILLFCLIFYYTLPLHRVFEAAFGAITGFSIYVLLSVILLSHPDLGTQGGLFPLGFSIFLVSISVYLIFVLALLFPLHGGLVISEPTQPTISSILHIFVTFFLFFSLGATCIYMIEQSYVFQVGNIFTWIKDSPFYISTIKPSWFYAYVISHQNSIIPLAIVLMLYKLLLSNIINAALLSIWYNLANVGFYRKKEDSHYRVEFHEVGGHASSSEHGHDDHSHGDDHSDHSHSSTHH